MNRKLTEKTAHELAEMLRNRTISAVELTRSVFESIHEREEDIKGYMTLLEKEAIEASGAIDRERIKGTDLPPLAGIPVAIKDAICTKGIRTTCSSRMLENFVPPYDAHIMDKIHAEKMIVIGKTNMDEFAMGSSNETSGFHPTRNPWDLGRIPGGSSGGSAAVVSADEAILAIGSDTGGSIRQPASMCGVVGMKPTYGRVSRYGLVAFASSLDQIGPVAKDIEDAAMFLNVIAGHDRRDSTSADLAVPDYTSFLNKDIDGLRIGVPKEYMIEGIDPEVKARIQEAIDQLASLGAEIIEVSLPHAEYAIPVYYIIATAEASSNLSRYDGVHYGHRSEKATDLIDMYIKSRAEAFGKEVKRRIMLGTYVLSSGYYDAYYLKAQKVRTLIRRDFEEAFKNVDVIVGPTSPTTAFNLGEKTDDPLQMYLSDIFTISLNLAGITGLSLPCGLASGLPVGLQMIAPAFEEGRLFHAAHAFEQSTEHHKLRPNLAGRETL